MKSRSIDRKTIMSLLTSLTFILASCMNSQGTMISPMSTSTIPKPIGTTTFTETETSTPITPTPTRTETPFPSITPLPTLANSEVQNYLTNLIQNPGSCKLPCWWGLTPGTSSWQDVKDFMFHIGIKNIGGAYHTLEKNFDIANPFIQQNIMINENDNILSNIWFSVAGYYSPSQFQSIWNLYTPKKILASYGKPSRIYFSISTVNDQNPAGKKIGEGYTMWLFYDPQGFLIRYEGLGKVQNQNIHICPTLGYEAIDSLYFYLQDPTSSTLLEYMVDGFQGEFGKSGFETLPLEKATGLSIDQFMGLATGKINCFDTPYSIWP
jgi:hypothetical protein